MTDSWNDIFNGQFKKKETEYERGYKDGMAGAALPNIIDNGDKIDGYDYIYKTDSEGVPHINIDSVRAMLTKATDAQSINMDFAESRNMDDVQYTYFKFIEPLEKRVKELEKEIKSLREAIKR